MKGSVVNDNWLVLKQIGKGTFSEIYLGWNIHSNDSPVALKIQALGDGKEMPNEKEGRQSVSFFQGAGIGSGVLRSEAEVLQSMKSVPTVPQFLLFDQHKDKYEYIAMEYLSGEDMSKLRDQTRSSLKAIPLPIVCYLTNQMFHCIKNFHLKGFIHRDIKPANFVRRSLSSTEYCLLDFGISKIHRDCNDIVRPKREIAEFRGTSAYASPHAHLKEDLCPRDDFYSLFFVFVDLLCGSLPWTEAAKSKQKQIICDLKLDFINKRNDFIEWVITSAVNVHTVLGDLDDQFPERIRVNLNKLLDHLSSLSFEDVPNFDLIEFCFTSILLQPSSLLNPNNILYREYNFKWNRDENQSFSDNKTFLNQIRLDFVKLLDNKNVFQTVIYTKAKYLLKQITKELELTSTTSDNEDNVCDNNKNNTEFESREDARMEVENVSKEDNINKMEDNTNYDQLFALLMSCSNSENNNETNNENNDNNFDNFKFVSPEEMSLTHTDRELKENSNNTSVLTNDSNNIFSVSQNDNNSSSNLLIEKKRKRSISMSSQSIENKKENKKEKQIVGRVAPVVSIEFAKKWAEIVDEFEQKIPVKEMRRDVVDLLEYILREFGRFFYCDLSDINNKTSDSCKIVFDNIDDLLNFDNDFVDIDENDEKWQAFVNIQKTVYRFTEKIRKSVYVNSEVKQC